jgi:hypothetical protein
VILKDCSLDVEGARGMNSLNLYIKKSFYSQLRSSTTTS